MMSPERRTLLGMFAGIGLFLLAGEIICLFFLPKSLAVMAGLAFGAISSVGLAFHMYKTLDVTISLPEKSAVSYARRQSLLRMLIMMAVLAVSAKLNSYVNLFGTLIGLFFLKFAAYLQPIIDKWLFRKERESEEMKGR
ncbi:MAG: ATP synthase subunit I [Lachnospiraceae bacterium]|nr:ATP synthase subunit I [Lachnospiraceae bacterium]